MTQAAILTFNGGILSFLTFIQGSSVLKKQFHKPKFNSINTSLNSVLKYSSAFVCCIFKVCAILSQKYC